MELRPRKEITPALLAATLTILRAFRREINDGRHKLPSWSVVRPHKLIGEK